MMLDEITLIGAFAIIGSFTFLFRAIFLFTMPKLLKNKTIKNGLDSVPSALLVALVVPYTFFTTAGFEPFRIYVLAILLTVPLIYYIKKPGLSLPIAIIILVVVGSVKMSLGF